MRPSSEACLWASSASRISRSARRRSCSFARCTTSSLSGSATEARMATIATVITSSISVKPREPHCVAGGGWTPPNGTMLGGAGWATARLAPRSCGMPGCAAAGLRRARRLRDARRQRTAPARRRARRSRPRCRRRTRPSARLGPLQRAHQARRDEQHDLGLRRVVARGREQAADDRQLAQAGHAARALRRSSSLIRPASTCVSPSRSRSTVAALRVPIW